MKNIFKGEVMALMPTYVKDQGNSTILFKKGKKHLIINKTIKTCLHLLCKYYMVDLDEVRKRYRPIILSTNLVPITLSKRDIFIPFKTRIPICKNDGAFSYINLRYIEKLKDKENGPLVYLEDKTKIQCLSKITTVENHIKNARIISRCYENIGMGVAENDEIYRWIWKIIPYI